MSEEVMRKHIDLYVNNYSINLGEDGRDAVKKFLAVYQTIHPQNKIQAPDIFVKSNI